MGARSFVIFCVIVAGVGVLCQLDCFRESRTTAFAFIHKHFGDLFGCCPIHMSENIIKKLVAIPGALHGLANSVISQISDPEKSGLGYSRTGIQIVRYDTTSRLFTKEELKPYIGAEDSPGMYLAILGRVYDVTGGERFYAPGKGYHFFSGIDGTKAFMTGEFNEKGLIDDVTGLSNAQMIELEDWLKFYDNHDTYKYVGKIIGNFYDSDGNPTPALLAAFDAVEAGHDWKSQEEDFRKQFPPCNSAHTSAGGSVSCSDKSGGIKRDWVGVPRKYHRPGKPNPTCVCVRTTGPPYSSPESDTNRGELDNPYIEEYPGCDPTADYCPLPKQ